MRTLNFHADPVHACLEVPIAELVSLGIDDSISCYSYAKGDTAYLEEDCDAGRYLNKLKESGTEFKFNEIYAENTPIRNYNSFTRR